MRVYRLISRTRVEGPGVRACIWVQGCSHGCRGCYAQHLWDREGGYEASVQDLIDEITPVLDQICGLTILGGEPFDQAGELSELASFAQEKGKNVICFTGGIYEDLLSQGGEKARLLKHTDLLCDGPYVEALHDDSRPMLGSSNQRYIFLTDALTEEDMLSFKDAYEIRADESGRIQINGKGNLAKLKDYLKTINGGKDGFTYI